MDCSNSSATGYSLPPAAKIDVIAGLFDARRAGPRQWQARCPGPLHQHGDRDPSLSIREGRDGRVLIVCRVGCRTAEVLHAAGLRWSDLFPGPPPTPEQARKAERQRRIAETEARARRRERRELADRYRKLNELAHAIAARLGEMPQGNEGDELALVYHNAIDKLCDIEAIYDEIERREFHGRLVPCCARHGIDYRRLLEPFMDKEESAQKTLEAAA